MKKNPFEKGSQNYMILEALKAKRQLTPIDANTKEFDYCMRLSARIYDIRKSGINVKAKEVNTYNKKTNKHKRYAKYYL